MKSQFRDIPFQNTTAVIFAEKTLTGNQVFPSLQVIHFTFTTLHQEAQNLGVCISVELMEGRITMTGDGLGLLHPEACH